MKKRHYILSCLLALALLPLKAQGELVVDWTCYAQDTVAPIYTHCADLGYDHQGRDYSVSIEYPELKPLTAEEVTRFRLPTQNGLPEWPVIEVHKGISAKRGQLDISFIPHHLAPWTVSEDCEFYTEGRCCNQWTVGC